MSTPLLGSFSLCGSCGRDRGPLVERCVCGAPGEAWQMVGAAPPGAMIDTRLGAIFFGGLALLIALAIASSSSFLASS